ncbi:MAG: DNA polymerase IV, partial [Dehalococcoidales bacterium]
VDLDAFFVSVEQVLNPELQGKPVVVGGRPGGRGVVAAASYEARAFGLYSSMPLVTASRLCPQAIFIEGNYTRYRDASQKFMAILADFTPFVEPAGLDEAYLDVTGFESIHGSIHEMAVKIKQRVKNETGLCASVGIASSKIVAKVASDSSKPDGLIEVARGKEHSFLAPMAVNRLPGVGKRTEQKLKGLGINTIGEMYDLPLAALKSHFGASGEALYRFTRGQDNRRVEVPGVARSISRETTFQEDTRDQSRLKATLRYLGERVGADLRSRNKRAKCVTLKLRYADFTTITRRHTLKKPADSDRVIYDTGEGLLERALAQEKQAVRLIGTGVSGLVESGQQLDMLDAQTRRQEQLNMAIDRIRDRYGFTAIQTGQTLLLKDLYKKDGGRYSLDTPSLSR